MNIFNDCC